MKSPELLRRAVVPAMAVFALGITACSGENAGNQADSKEWPVHNAPEADRWVDPRPLDNMALSTVVPTLEKPQKWGKDHMIQIDSRHTKPVGGPVGAYIAPTQEGNSPWDLKDGEEYRAMCFVDERDDAQYITADNLEGSNVWYKLDIDNDGNGDGYVPATNAGFTGLTNEGAFDGGLDRC